MVYTNTRMFSIIPLTFLIVVVASNCVTEEPRNIPPKCKRHEHFETNYSKCQITCTNRKWIDPDSTCKPFTGCVCDHGYLRLYENGTGLCIPEDKCPPDPIYCGPHEKLSDCKIICPPQSCETLYITYICEGFENICSKGCDCIEGYLRNSLGMCIPRSFCPPAEYYYDLFYNDGDDLIFSYQKSKSVNEEDQFDRFSSSSDSSSSSSQTSTTSLANASSNSKSMEKKLTSTKTSSSDSKSSTIHSSHTTSTNSQFTNTNTSSNQSSSSVIKNVATSNSQVKSLNEISANQNCSSSISKVSLSDRSTDNSSSKVTSSTMGKTSSFSRETSGGTSNNQSSASSSCSSTDAASSNQSFLLAETSANTESKSCNESSAKVTSSAKTYSSSSAHSTCVNNSSSNTTINQECSKPNEVWHLCPSVCLLENCDDVDCPPVVCTKKQVCNPRCICKKYHYRNASGICIHMDNCPYYEYEL